MFLNIIKDIFLAYVAKKKSCKNGHVWTKTPFWVNPFWKTVNFSTFCTFCYYSLERRFFVLEYHIRHFSGLYCLKKKVGKMAIFGPKPWVNPFGKMSIFRHFWTSCFYSLERWYFVLECHKRHFPGLYCVRKKAGKMANFGPKRWPKPFGKMSSFRVFGVLVFLA